MSVWMHMWLCVKMCVCVSVCECFDLCFEVQTVTLCSARPLQMATPLHLSNGGEKEGEREGVRMREKERERDGWCDRDVKRVTRKDKASEIWWLIAGHQLEGGVANCHGSALHP